ncbi:exodeoxyribonuclease VII small subunit [Thiomicrorhabdus heinhorstiae]|uniref:Exodeoxyribonuclease VII small subunit n=1 Tax=Thiomicrorhabdus heinhorstiae TaxID=2748010 RepID=A0ABS0BXV1_9GAMM|nr:exodeoxyribonuclease VII small subunit [Thiomicrorhabdus heinhorstiae]MBF6056882.1 exodeoxyribonuclease VII small subunit [Thiomicrorhabdus heinhorstiae]
MSQSESFKDNYLTLQTIAQKLSNNNEIDIDELIPMVDEATKAYQLCKQRIEAVEQALNSRLDNETENAIESE